MPRLIWTPRALADLHRLHSFLREKNPDAANRAITAIRVGVSVLGVHTHIGRQLDTMPPGFRGGPVGFGAKGYFVVYHEAAGKYLSSPFDTAVSRSVSRPHVDRLPYRPRPPLMRPKTTETDT